MGGGGGFSWALPDFHRGTGSFGLCYKWSPLETWLVCVIEHRMIIGSD